MSISTSERSALDDLFRRARGAAVSGSDERILGDLDEALGRATDATTRAHLHLASATVTQGSSDRTLSALSSERAVAVLRRADDHVSHAVAAAIASTFVARTGRREEALSLVVEALAVAEQADFTGIEGVRHANAVATTLYEMGAFAEGEHYAREAFENGRNSSSEVREIVSITLVWTLLEHAIAGGPEPDEETVGSVLGIFDRPDATPVGRELIGPVLRSEVALLRGDAVEAELAWASSTRRGELPARLRGWVELVLAEHAFRADRAAVCLARLDAAAELLEYAVDEHRSVRAGLLRLRSLAALDRTADVMALADHLVTSSRRHTVDARGDLAVELSTRVAIERTARQLRDTSGALAEAIAVDPLTRVGSRHRYEEIRERSSEATGEGSVFLVDLDGLKAVNDRHGHAVGDRVLGAVGSLLQRCFAPTDEIVRLGGDEFVVILETDDEDVLAAVRHRLMAMFRDEPWSELGSSVFVTASVGVASGPLREFDRLVGEADAAMYRVKRAGGDGLSSA